MSFFSVEPGALAADGVGLEKVAAALRVAHSYDEVPGASAYGAITSAVGESSHAWTASMYAAEDYIEALGKVAGEASGTMSMWPSRRSQTTAGGSWRGTFPS